MLINYPLMFFEILLYFFPSAAVRSKMEHTEASSNSSVVKMLRICLVTAGRFTPNRIAICSCVNHTVPFSTLTSNFVISSV